MVELFPPVKVAPTLLSAPIELVVVLERMLDIPP
jgi:hypothetical protein